VVKRVFATLSVAVTIAALSAASSASADTVINGPINLGTAANYGALAGSTVTNTGATEITGLVGVYPGSAITGFPPGISAGEQAATTTEAAAQSDLTIAYGVASSLTPTATGLGDLVGQTLVAGVYQGGVLSLSGDVTLDGEGNADAVWVFQADSALDVGSGSRVLLTNGANACNVFWKVGSSATIESSAQFVGTVLADQAIFARTGASIEGRLLARIAEVTLQANDITVPSGCSAAGVVSSSPVITSGAPTTASLDRAYSFTIAAAGSPGSTFSIDSGSLPAGLTLDGATGRITGTPTALGSSTFVVRASNGVPSDSLVTLSITVSPAALAATGLESTVPVLAAGIVLVLAGLTLRRRSSLRVP